MKSMALKRKMICLIGTVLLLSSLGAGDAAAQDSGTWQYEVMLYGWLSSVDGSTNVPAGYGQSVSVDASDILDSLNGLFEAGFVARHDRWSILADLIYIDLQNSKNRSLTGPRFGEPINANIDLGITSWIVSGGVAYDVLQSSHGTLALVGGLRYLNLDVTTGFAATGAASLVDPSVKASNSESYLDGIVGIRGAIDLNEHWYLSYYADIGAGGSDLTYQVLAGIGYHYDWFDVKLIYRYLAYEFDDTKLLEDVSLNGPLLGLGVRF